MIPPPLQVLHLHLFLGVQDLLRVRLLATRHAYSRRRYHVCDDRLLLLPPQRRGLQMEVRY